VTSPARCSLPRPTPQTLAAQTPVSPNEGPPDAGHGARTLGASVSVHTTMGLPGSAGVDERSLWLLVKPQYVVSYNSTTKTPNWVSLGAELQLVRLGLALLVLPARP
jgi:DNA/RNA endonuclease G (NUC1)